MAKKKSEAEKFHHKHGGYNYGPGETKAQGKSRSAKEAAKAEEIAEEQGWEFRWEDDPQPYEMGDAETERPDEVLTVIMVDETGSVLQSLGGIGLSGSQSERRNYCRTIEAELAREEASNRKLI
jgi:hypothetical protein